MSRSLLIVGGATPNEGSRTFPKGFDETWTFLSVAKQDKNVRLKADLVWDCHGPKTLEAYRKRSKYHNDKMNIFDLRGLDVSSSKLLGFRRAELTSVYGTRMSSQLTWMLAYALGDRQTDDEPRYDLIGLWRFYPKDDDEAYHQLSDVMYFVGWGRSKGVKFMTDPHSILFQPKLYGLEKETKEVPF